MLQLLLKNTDDSSREAGGEEDEKAKMFFLSWGDLLGSLGRLQGLALGHTHPLTPHPKPTWHIYGMHLKQDRGCQKLSVIGLVYFSHACWCVYVCMVVNMCVCECHNLQNLNVEKRVESSRTYSISPFPSVTTHAFVHFLYSQYSVLYCWPIIEERSSNKKYW